MLKLVKNRPSSQLRTGAAHICNELPPLLLSSNYKDKFIASISHYRQIKLRGLLSLLQALSQRQQHEVQHQYLGETKIACCLTH